ncbi:uncharacterized protein [Apostichopus japonicus]|uniref:uncharacterized protein n=1 Tax=Stichopus japonicus TaxID=307972 RepID=UPI003AB4E021
MAFHSHHPITLTNPSPSPSHHPHQLLTIPSPSPSHHPHQPITLTNRSPSPTHHPHQPITLTIIIPSPSPTHHPHHPITLTNPSPSPTHHPHQPITLITLTIPSPSPTPHHPSPTHHPHHPITLTNPSPSHTLYDYFLSMHEKVLHAYLKLRVGGGFEYLKANTPNKVLDAIPYPARGTQPMQSICGKAPIYLRPIQCDLSLVKVDIEHKKLKLQDIEETRCQGHASTSSSVISVKSADKCTSGQDDEESYSDATEGDEDTSFDADAVSRRHNLHNLPGEHSAAVESHPCTNLFKKKLCTSPVRITNKTVVTAVTVYWPSSIDKARNPVVTIDYQKHKNRKQLQREGESGLFSPQKVPIENLGDAAQSEEKHGSSLNTESSGSDSYRDILTSHKKDMIDKDGYLQGVQGIKMTNEAIHDRMKTLKDSIVKSEDSVKTLVAEIKMLGQRVVQSHKAVQKEEEPEPPMVSTMEQLPRDLQKTSFQFL